RHKTALFLQLLNNWGPNYFDSIRNWDKEKNKLLQGYGYSLEDDLTGKFEFIYKEGKPFLKVLDSSVKRVSSVMQSRPEAVSVAEDEMPQPVSIKNKRVGLVFNSNEKSFPFLSIDLVQGNYDYANNQFAGNVEKLDLTKFINT